MSELHFRIVSRFLRETGAANLRWVSLPVIQETGWVRPGDEPTQEDTETHQEEAVVDDGLRYVLEYNVYRSTPVERVSVYDHRVKPGARVTTSTSPVQVQIHRGEHKNPAGYVTFNGGEARRPGQTTAFATEAAAKEAAEQHYLKAQVSPETDPAKVLAKLTKAQKQFILDAYENPEHPGRIEDPWDSPSRALVTRMIANLEKLGLTARFHDTLTPLGMEVAKLIRR